MTNDQAMNFVGMYYAKYVPEAKAGWPDYYLRRTAYSAWAIEEILDRLERSTDEPVQTVKRFMEEMYEFYGMNDGPRSVVFSYAYETAEELYISLLRKAELLKGV